MLCLNVRIYVILAYNNVYFLLLQGMLIDLRQSSKLLYYQGDESTILPTTSYKTLKTALQMDIKQKEDKKMRNMLISEAFLRFFVDILGDFWRFFKDGELEDRGFGRGNVVFDVSISLL